MSGRFASVLVAFAKQLSVTFSGPCSVTKLLCVDASSCVIRARHDGGWCPIACFADEVSYLVEHDSTGDTKMHSTQVYLIIHCVQAFLFIEAFIADAWRGNPLCVAYRHNFPTLVNLP